MIDTTTTKLLRTLMSRLVNMFLPVYQRNVVGSAVHTKSIPVMAESEFNRRYGSQKKVKMVERVVGIFAMIVRDQTSEWKSSNDRTIDS